jgi:hypothetical protein
MKKFKGLNVHGQKYVRGWSKADYCLNQNHNNCNDCQKCLFCTDYADEIFSEWVKVNENSINWKAKDRESPYTILINGVILFKFRTETLRNNAIREIKRLVKTLPKG